MTAGNFISRRLLRRAGLVDVFLLYFQHVSCRRVFLAGLTARPDRAWAVQQARNFLLQAGEQTDKPALLLCDFDRKFVPEFDAVQQAEGVTVKRVDPRAPNLNAYVECCVQSVRLECLYHLVVFGSAAWPPRGRGRRLLQPLPPPLGVRQLSLGRGRGDGGCCGRDPDLLRGTAGRATPTLISTLGVSGPRRDRAIANRKTDPRPTPTATRAVNLGRTTGIPCLPVAPPGSAVRHTRSHVSAHPNPPLEQIDPVKDTSQLRSPAALTADTTIE